MYCCHVWSGSCLAPLCCAVLRFPFFNVLSIFHIWYKAHDYQACTLLMLLRAAHKPFRFWMRALNTLHVFLSETLHFCGCVLPCFLHKLPSLCDLQWFCVGTLATSAASSCADPTGHIQTCSSFIQVCQMGWRRGGWEQTHVQTMQEEPLQLTGWEQEYLMKMGA